MITKTMNQASLIKSVHDFKEQYIFQGFPLEFKVGIFVRLLEKSLLWDVLL